MNNMKRATEEQKTYIAGEDLRMGFVYIGRDGKAYQSPGSLRPAPTGEKV